jgi:hypothetical protein
MRAKINCRKRSCLTNQWISAEPKKGELSIGAGVPYAQSLCAAAGPEGTIAMDQPGRNRCRPPDPARR